MGALTGISGKSPRSDREIHAPPPQNRRSTSRVQIWGWCMFCLPLDEEGLLWGWCVVGGPLPGRLPNKTAIKLFCSHFTGGGCLCMYAKGSVLPMIPYAHCSGARGDHPNSQNNAPRMHRQMKKSTRGSHQFWELLQELLRELWFRIAQVVRRPSENGISHSENYFLNSKSSSENTPERSQSSENSFFTPRAFFLKLGSPPGF